MSGYLVHPNCGSSQMNADCSTGMFTFKFGQKRVLNGLEVKMAGVKGRKRSPVKRTEAS